MSLGNGLESLFWKMLEKNHLVHLSQFHQTDFFEEVPLYSRFSDVAFLEDHKPEKADVLLLRFALKYLRSLISYEEHKNPFLAAITVSDFSPGDPMVPNLFVWSRPIVDLYGKLRLTAPSTSFSKRVRKLVSLARLGDRHEVLQDLDSAPDSPRVFIGPSVSPYPSFVPIYTFAHDFGSGASTRGKAKTGK